MEISQKDLRNKGRLMALYFVLLKLHKWWILKDSYVFWLSERTIAETPLCRSEGWYQWYSAALQFVEFFPFTNKYFRYPFKNALVVCSSANFNNFEYVMYSTVNNS